MTRIFTGPEKRLGDTNRAIARSEHRAGRAPHRVTTCLDQRRPSAIAPSKTFIALTRNPSLEPPSRFEPTVKREGDVVL